MTFRKLIEKLNKLPESELDKEAKFYEYSEGTTHLYLIDFSQAGEDLKHKHKNGYIYDDFSIQKDDWFFH